MALRYNRLAITNIALNARNVKCCANTCVRVRTLLNALSVCLL